MHIFIYRKREKNKNAVYTMHINILHILFTYLTYLN